MHIVIGHSINAVYIIYDIFTVEHIFRIYVSMYAGMYVSSIYVHFDMYLCMQICMYPAFTCILGNFSKSIHACTHTLNCDC